MKRVILYRDPRNHEHTNDSAPTALEFRVPDAREENYPNWLVLTLEGGVELSILFPTNGDVYFNEWSFDRFEIEDINE